MIQTIRSWQNALKTQVISGRFVLDLKVTFNNVVCPAVIRFGSMYQSIKQSIFWQNRKQVFQCCEDMQYCPNPVILLPFFGSGDSFLVVVCIVLELVLRVLWGPFSHC